MEFPSLSEVPPLTDLVFSLENATLMAKQLPSTTDPSQVFHISSSLQNAHHQLGLFLSRFHSSQPQAMENSPSSAIGEGEPMQIGDDDEVEKEQVVVEEEEDSRVIIENVEERMKNCYLQSKRRKRHLSPSSVAVDQGFYNDNELVIRGVMDTFDPQATRLRSLDLIYQFHG